MKNNGKTMKNDEKRWKKRLDSTHPVDSRSPTFAFKLLRTRCPRTVAWIEIAARSCCCTLFRTTSFSSQLTQNAFILIKDMLDLVIVGTFACRLASSYSSINICWKFGSLHNAALLLLIK